MRPPQELAKALSGPHYLHAMCSVACSKWGQIYWYLSPVTGHSGGVEGDLGGGGLSTSLTVGSFRTCLSFFPVTFLSGCSQWIRPSCPPSPHHAQRLSGFRHPPPPLVAQVTRGYVTLRPPHLCCCVLWCPCLFLPVPCLCPLKSVFCVLGALVKGRYAGSCLPSVFKGDFHSGL